MTDLLTHCGQNTSPEIVSLLQRATAKSSQRRWRAGRRTRQTSQAWLLNPSPRKRSHPQPSEPEDALLAPLDYLPVVSGAGKDASCRKGVPGLGQRKGWRRESKRCLVATIREFRGVWTAAPAQNTEEDLSTPHYAAVLLLEQPAPRPRLQGGALGRGSAYTRGCWGPPNGPACQGQGEQRDLSDSARVRPAGTQAISHFRELEEWAQASGKKFVEAAGSESGARSLSSPHLSHREIHTSGAAEDPVAGSISPETGRPAPRLRIRTKLKVLVRIFQPGGNSGHLR
ncbi:uncharacterized protein LOC117724697 [Arvicanthis niloticus]|uniref:uncharacterized protein LOC117724697 n=1 Tax=Arvicanthis niloticus TaxID=61156 RepID=UPI001485F5BD|nr:uncharacterized protein LOC117724697 [Arvicanthis niloticus]